MPGQTCRAHVAGQLRTLARPVFEFGCAQQGLRERVEAAHTRAAVGA